MMLLWDPDTQVISLFVTVIHLNAMLRLHTLFLISRLQVFLL